MVRGSLIWEKSRKSYTFNVSIMETGKLIKFIFIMGDSDVRVTDDVVDAGARIIDDDPVVMNLCYYGVCGLDTSGVYIVGLVDSPFFCRAFMYMYRYWYFVYDSCYI
jgi:hypothetical protein